MYDELVKSLRICGEWGTEVRIPGEPSECAGCSYYNAEKDECKSWDEPWRKEHLLLDAANAIEELQAQINGWIEQERKSLLKSVPRWIPVTERLPSTRRPGLPTQYYNCGISDKGQAITHILEDIIDDFIQNNAARIGRFIAEAEEAEEDGEEEDPDE